MVWAIFVDYKSFSGYNAFMDIIPQLILNSLIAGATYTLIALGFNLIYGTTKFINIAHGTIAIAGAYIVLLLAKSYEIPLVFSILLGIGAAGFLGFLLYRLVFSPLLQQKASPLVLFVSSLGAFAALESLFAIFFSSRFEVLPLPKKLQGVYEIGGGAITLLQLASILIAFLVFILLIFVMKRTKFGKVIRAISDDEEAARIVGIDTKKMIGAVFMIGSSLGGVAGILIGFDLGFQPTSGLLILLEGAIASIIGGIGNIYGGVLGSFLLAFVENFGIWKISGEWKTAIALGVLVIFLIFRPKGIMQK
ncbi:MAG: branched-chain amino acid ABC transporter permease [Candidatus Portnoybacteria bacterium]|nr:branched-chain amino acid ABC transporter permease [Candidatus Portnoybacteria bacterium]